MPAEPGSHLRKFPECLTLRLVFISHCPELHHVSTPKQQRKELRFLTGHLVTWKNTLDYDSNKTIELGCQLSACYTHISHAWENPHTACYILPLLNQFCNLDSVDCNSDI